MKIVHEWINKELINLNGENTLNILEGKDLEEGFYNCRIYTNRGVLNRRLIVPIK